MQAHPAETAREVSEMTGIPPNRVAYVRKRFGRGWDRAASVCVACDSRPVWQESPPARRMHLCKGCYLEEMRRRHAEDRDGAAVRQMAKRDRDGRGRGGH